MSENFCPAANAELSFTENERIPAEALSFYEEGKEWNRLRTGLGLIEFERTKEQYRAIQFRRLRLFVNGVLDSGHFAFLVASLPPCDISGFFKLPNGGTDSVDTFPVDVGQPRKGVVPILWQGQHLR